MTVKYLIFGVPIFVQTERSNSTRAILSESLAWVSNLDVCAVPVRVDIPQKKTPGRFVVVLQQVGHRRTYIPRNGELYGTA